MTDIKSFWATLPGILTGIAGVITAIGGLLLIIQEGPQPNGNWNEIEEKRATMEKRINEIEHYIPRLVAEIESLIQEAKRNPDAEMALKEKERRVGALEREIQGLQEEIGQLPHRLP
ncbi:MAG: hypothetical protein JJW03_01840 [Desulfosarcina sp.]|nr:hypothetical protein [Desulfobacterales bacterium]